MCGITGVLSAAPVDPGVVATMRDTLRHRGPDAEGLWRSPDGRVCLGHRRLSIIDLDPRSTQPFASADGRHVLVFNGEIYNFRALRRELLQLGARFHTESDTEVLLEAYRQWGAECLPRLSGMFAFAVWDARARTLFCARDRVGEKPFYWALAGDTFVFGSELKAIVAWPGFRKRLDPVAVAEFLHFGFVADPRAIWEGAHKLPPAHSLTVHLGEGAPVVGTPARWWDMRFDPDHGVDDWTPLVLDTLEGAVSEMSVADVPLGTFLSGGVDSSAITAALARAGHKVTAFTIGFADDPEDERPWARAVAERYGVRQEVRELGPHDVTRAFDELLWHYDEPFNDTSVLPTYEVCAAARSQLTVSLSGDGGDELFAGYRRYHYLATRQLKFGWVSPAAARTASRAATALLPAASGVRKRLARFASERDALLSDMIAIGHSGELLQSAARGPLAAALRDYAPRDTVAEHLARLPAETSLVDAMRYVDLKLTLAGGMLVKVDRASMAVSLEVRAGFVHPALLELAGRIPAEKLVQGGEPKSELKRALRQWLPDGLLYRRKRGFSAPLGQWMRGDDRALPGAGRGGPLDELVDPSLVASLRERHAAGGADLSRTIYSLVLLDRWLARWG